MLAFAFYQLPNLLLDTRCRELGPARAMHVSEQAGGNETLDPHANGWVSVTSLPLDSMSGFALQVQPHQLSTLIGRQRYHVASRCTHTPSPAASERQIVPVGHNW